MPRKPKATWAQLDDRNRPESDAVEIFMAAMRKLFADGISVSDLVNISAGNYEPVAASDTNEVLGDTGAVGDYLAGLLIVPATTSPGAVSVKDGSGSSITLFTGGASSVSNLVPFFVPLGAKSTSGAWSVTTGANVSVVAVGNFS